MNYVIDASAWIEYFNGSKEGEKVKEVVENEIHKIYTNVITFAELASFFRRKEHDFQKAKEMIISLSSWYALDPLFAQEAGELLVEMKKTRKKIGLADILVLLTARKVEGKVVTADQDFKGLKETLLIS